MNKPRRHKKLSTGKVSEDIGKQLSGNSLSAYLKNAAGEKEAEFIKPGTKIKLAWQVTYKKK